MPRMTSNEPNRLDELIDDITASTTDALMPLILAAQHEAWNKCREAAAFEQLTGADPTPNPYPYELDD